MTTRSKIFGSPQFNTPVSSTHQFNQKGHSFAAPEIRQINTKKRQFNTKNRLFNTLVSSTHPSVPHKNPSVQHRSVNSTKIALCFVSNWRFSVLNWRVCRPDVFCVELTGVLNWRIWRVEQTHLTCWSDGFWHWNGVALMLNWRVLNISYIYTIND